VLVFLVLTTTFREATQLTVSLPQASTGELLRRDQRGRVRVVVDQQGRIFVSERNVDLRALRTLLETIGDRDGAHVLLAADEHADHGRVVDVMDVVRQVGISRLSIETIDDTPVETSTGR
jgi:biopolymer transport protein ExbD